MCTLAHFSDFADECLEFSDLYVIRQLPSARCFQSRQFSFHRNKSFSHILSVYIFKSRNKRNKYNWNQRVEKAAQVTLGQIHTWPNHRTATRYASGSVLQARVLHRVQQAQAEILHLIPWVETTASILACSDIMLKFYL